MFSMNVKREYLVELGRLAEEGESKGRREDASRLRF